MPSAADRMRPGRRGCRRPSGGFTLVEVGFVVGLLGLLAVLVSDFYITQLNLRYASQRADGAVRDMRQIVDAALAWREGDVNGFWPHDGTRIAIGQLATDGYLPRIPANRYTGCGGPAACGGYSLVGWDRDAAGTTGAYTERFMNADDLVVRVDVWGGDAHGIASQLPLGTAALVSGQRYRVEARVTYDGFGDRFVRLRNEGRALAFGDLLDDRDERLPVGDLRGVARIAWSREVPLDADGNEPDLYRRGSDGTYERRTPSGAAIVAEPQGADPAETGPGITLAKDAVTIHGALLVRSLRRRDQAPTEPANIGEVLGALQANHETLEGRVAILEAAP